ncbi:MAG TPA: hypothetical protein VFI17_02570 [Solirubrobacterales bacterium]|nr:hypothetical protein [Solirubrobacterales bacterium]
MNQVPDTACIGDTTYGAINAEINFVLHLDPGKKRGDLASWRSDQPGEINPLARLTHGALLTGPRGYRSSSGAERHAGNPTLQTGWANPPEPAAAITKPSSPEEIYQLLGEHRQ